jgi:hypothetical protein
MTRFMILKRIHGRSYWRGRRIHAPPGPLPLAHI